MNITSPAATCLTLSSPHAILKNQKKNWFRFGQVKYNTIYAFGENNESGIRSRQVPVWRGLISIVLSVINSGPNKDYGIDRIPVCTGSGMYRLHCIRIWCGLTYQKFTKIWQCKKYNFQDGVRDGRQILKIPIICPLIKNDSFWCIVSSFGFNMVPIEFHTVKIYFLNFSKRPNIKGINKNHSIHHFPSTILLQELGLLCLIGLTLTFE